MNKAKHISNRNQSEKQIKNVDLQWMQQSSYPFLIVVLSVAIAAMAIPGDILEIDQLRQHIQPEIKDTTHSQEIHTLFVS